MYFAVGILIVQVEMPFCRM